MAEQGFESLKVWQKAHQMMLDIHKKLVPLLPKDENTISLTRFGVHQKVLARILLRAMGAFIIWIMSGSVTMRVVL
jgi:hypothetical protein